MVVVVGDEVDGGGGVGGGEPGLAEGAGGGFEPVMALADDNVELCAVGEGVVEEVEVAVVRRPEFANDEAAGG